MNSSPLLTSPKGEEPHSDSKQADLKPLPLGGGWEGALDYLYHAAPMFQNVGAGAYKEGLSTTRALDAHFGHPHRRYRTIHVAGTNGKGSVSSTLAAILQSAGLRVGLYTSPHLVDFRERIRVDGQMIPEQRVVDFVEQERAFFEPLSPSFFELTTALAFLYFAEQAVDVAVIEVGLGGRLDCTNIITPDLSVITNISFDHQQFLGSTLAAIAAEKAGIIKAGVPVVIGETGTGPSAVEDPSAATDPSAVEDPSPSSPVRGGVVTVQEVKPRGGEAPVKSHSEVREVFVRTFEAVNRNLVDAANGNTSPSSHLLPSLRFADEEPLHSEVTAPPLTGEAGEGSSSGEVPFFQLRGAYQAANRRTILCALSELRRQPFYAARLTPSAIANGFAHVMELTGLRGRWQQLREHPTLVCDAGHNIAGIEVIVSQLLNQPCNRLHVVFGMVNDKDYHAAARLLARLVADASPAVAIPPAFYFTQPSCARALPAETLASAFREALDETSEGLSSGVEVQTFSSVDAAVSAALAAASEDDFIFVGGSCYVVADLLSLSSSSPCR